jgi:hypothetical protein
LKNNKGYTIIMGISGQIVGTPMSSDQRSPLVRLLEAEGPIATMGIDLLVE